MKLIEFPEQTIVIAKDQPQYQPLPAHRLPDDPEGRVTCCWQLTWAERFKLLFTGKLWHQILTFNTPLQPQLLLVEKPAMPLTARLLALRKLAEVDPETMDADELKALLDEDMTGPRQRLEEVLKKAKEQIEKEGHQ